MSELQFEIDIPFEGRSARARLRLLAWGDVAATAGPLEATSPEYRERQFRSSVFRALETFDGKKLFGKRLDALMADAPAVAAILYARYQLHTKLRAMGRVFARCPRCNAGEVELSLLGLFNALGVLPPEMISADFACFLQPAMGTFGLLEPRPKNVHYASQLRFELPSKIAGIPSPGITSGKLRPIDYRVEQAAMEKWEVHEVSVTAPAWWRHGNASFEATLRYIVGTYDVDPTMELTPDVFVKMPAADVYFLDAAYWCTHFATVPEHAPQRTCPQCQTSFLPLSQYGYAT